jgi:hypothetical protein
MRRIHMNRLLLFLTLCTVAFITSCTPEQKLAHGFIKNPPPIAIQLISPDALLKYNHKGEMIHGFDSLTAHQQDSALYASSEYIQYVDDSIFLEKYVNSFIDELRSLGFKVFVEESIDSFLRAQPQSYMLTMAQVELDEYLFPLVDSAYYGDSIFYKRFDINAVDETSWFEVSKINTPKPHKTTLRSTLTASDSFDGKFYLNGFSSEVMYKYTIDPLRISDIYDLARYSGKKHANYLYDYFMNQYVAIHLPEGEKMQGHLHYNHQDKLLEYSDEERFDVVK